MRNLSVTSSSVQPRLANGNFGSVDILVRLERNSKELSNGCREWLKYKDPAGYGRVAYDGVARMAHRVAYELNIAPVKKGLVLDHLCRDRSCINPNHLEQVTQSENILRGDHPKLNAEKFKNQTHCKYGHSLKNNRYERMRVDPKNGKTYIQRRCKTCVKERYARSKAVQV